MGAVKSRDAMIRVDREAIAYTLVHLVHVGSLRNAVRHCYRYSSTFGVSDSYE